MGSGEIRLSWQKGKGWKKSIGKHRGKDGQPRYKMWWLGSRKSDKTKAQALARFITLEWKQIKANGGEVWTADAEERIKTYRQSLYEPNKTQQDKVKRGAESDTVRDIPVISFHQAINYYCNNLNLTDFFTLIFTRLLIAAQAL